VINRHYNGGSALQKAAQNQRHTLFSMLLEALPRGERVNSLVPVMVIALRTEDIELMSMIQDLLKDDANAYHKLTLQTTVKMEDLDRIKKVLALLPPESCTEALDGILPAIMQLAVKSGDVEIVDEVLKLIPADLRGQAVDEALSAAEAGGDAGRNLYNALLVPAI
jgi:hypothetical protein